MRKRPSKLWKYFTKKDKDKADCHLCNRTLSISSGSMGNLRRHLNIKHAFDPSLEMTSAENITNLSAVTTFSSDNENNVSAAAIEDVKFMFHDEHEEVEEELLEQPREEIYRQQPHQKKRRLSSASEEDPFSEVEVIHGNGLIKDQYSVFGEEVGMRIRDLPSSYAKKIVKHIISTTLFEAEMGKYNNPNSYTIQPSVLPHFPQSFPQQSTDTDRKSKRRKGNQMYAETDCNDSNQSK